MCRTGAAGTYQRAFQRCTRAVGADGGITGGDVVPVGEVGQRSLIQINLADELGIVRRQRGQHRFYAMADEAEGCRIMRRKS